MLEEDVIYLVREAINTVSSKNLAYSGGVALSCITNRKIIDANIVENIFIQPSSSDEGIALGCALSGYYEEGGQTRTVMDNAYLGKDYDQKIISKKIDKSELIVPHPRLHNRNFVLIPIFEIDKNWKHPKLKLNITKLLLKIKSIDLRSIKLL